MTEDLRHPSRMAAASPQPPMALLWWRLALVVVGAIAMGNVVTHEFLTWDDPHTLTGNAFFNPPVWGGEDGILSAWDPAKPIGSLWVPVTYTLWGVIATFAWRHGTPGHPGSLEPAYFHVASLTGHLIASLIAFGLIRRLLAARGERRVWPAFAGAAIFACHPLQVEAVGWTSGFKDVLWVMWALAAVYSYIRSAERGLFWRSRWWWAGLLFFGLGTLSKPTAMVIPVLATVAHRFALGRGWREVVRGIWPWCPLTAAVFGWTIYFQDAHIVPTLPLPYRPLIALDAAAFYMWKVVWPLHLGFDYGRAPQVALRHGWLWWTWVFPVGAAALLWAKRRTWGPVVAGGTWVVVSIAPIAGLSPFLFQYFTTVADHYMYAGMAGVGLAVAWGLSRVPPGQVRAAQVAGGAVLTALIALSGLQMRTWHDSVSLYTQGLAVNPSSFASLTNLGSMHMQEAVTSPNARATALSYFDAALKIKPDYALAHNDRAFVFIFANRREEALRSVEAALASAESLPFEYRDSFVQAHVWLAEYLIREGRFEDAIRHYVEAGNELRRSRVTDRALFKKLENKIEETRRMAATRPSSGATRPTTRSSSRPVLPPGGP